MGSVFFDESPLFAHPNSHCRLQSKKLLGTVSVRCVGEHCHLTLLGRKAPAARAIQCRREKPGGSGDPKPGPSDPRHHPPSCPTGPTAPSSPHLLAQCNSPGLLQQLSRTRLKPRSTHSADFFLLFQANGLVQGSSWPGPSSSSSSPPCCRSSPSRCPPVPS